SRGLRAEPHGHRLGGRGDPGRPGAVDRTRPDLRAERIAARRARMSTVVASAAIARRQRRLSRGALAGRAGMWVVLLAALILSVAPGVYMLSVSFMDNPQLFAGRLVPWPPHAENYPRAWVASNIGRLYWNSIYVSTVSMVVTVAISALAGYGLARIRFAGRGLVYGIVLVGLTIPLQIALIPLFINLRTLGLINRSEER